MLTHLAPSVCADFSKFYVVSGRVQAVREKKQKGKNSARNSQPSQSCAPSWNDVLAKPTMSVSFCAPCNRFVCGSNFYRQLVLTCESWRWCKVVAMWSAFRIWHLCAFSFAKREDVLNGSISRHRFVFVACVLVPLALSFFDGIRL